MARASTRSTARLCQCEFINKRLALLDEFDRLDDKARQSDAAREAAMDAIGAVLAGNERNRGDGGGRARSSRCSKRAGSWRRRRG